MFQNASARPSLQTGAAPGTEFCDLWRIIPKITGGPGHCGFQIKADYKSHAATDEAVVVAEAVQRSTVHSTSKKLFQVMFLLRFVNKLQKRRFA